MKIPATSQSGRPTGRPTTTTTTMNTTKMTTTKMTTTTTTTMNTTTAPHRESITAIIAAITGQCVNATNEEALTIAARKIAAAAAAAAAALYVVETDSGQSYVKIRAASGAAAIAAAKIAGMTGNISALRLNEVLPTYGGDDHQSALELKHEERMLGTLNYSDQQFPRF
mgnify:FL=1